MTTNEKRGFEWPSGCRAAVSISFDDARLTQVDTGLPILDAHGVKGTFYVCEDPVRQRLDGWKGAVAKGHEIGNHTQTHPCGCNFPFARERSLEDYDLDKMVWELDTASHMIAELLGVEPTTFAYPCGQTYVGRGADTQSYVPLVAERFTVGRIWQSEYHNAPDICDLAQTNGTPLDRLSFNQAKAYVDTAIADGGWLVFAGHEVAAEGRQGIKPDTLDALCRWLREPDCPVWVDTVAAVGAYVAGKR